MNYRNMKKRCIIYSIVSFIASSINILLTSLMCIFMYSSAKSIFSYIGVFILTTIILSFPTIILYFFIMNTLYKDNYKCLIFNVLYPLTIAILIFIGIIL